MEAQNNEKKAPKKLTIKESQLQKLTTTEIDRRTLSPYDGIWPFQLMDK